MAFKCYARVWNATVCYTNVRHFSKAGEAVTRTKEQTGGAAPAISRLWISGPRERAPN
jgi:hypothetical protein